MPTDFQVVRQAAAMSNTWRAHTTSVSDSQKDYALCLYHDSLIVPHTVENPRWEKFINEQIRKWKMIVAENMLKNRGHQVFVVYYEKLKTSHLLQVTIAKL